MFKFNFIKGDYLKMNRTILLFIYIIIYYNLVIYTRVINNCTK
ncbi:hypothetical protein A1Q1_00008 (mitochondrion) [Trichosporon asahii var. asahii CBS 2479]|uniref:Uncharacterized protein n=1 Tax=Trichosporon asahii var. asahii (strain ATCC 90039 / CBS 2479 / JCM 2466 / KCTC 7840 / NBRC 103889/ NCYC 2677 / UAMH 7654) TaxID=1186058 RepID=J5SCT4_TRIAS|nr:hypothetical protein A1Q1_00008 [Trichosporon asahii var. asahii CBS 2479]EJT45006.1 hypothetical protein A1Q1_00008 [Trichosporon asahii var. asahii CBS 2479]